MSIADAGADRVDPRVGAHDGDLGPVARLARDSLDDHDAVMDFADFALEEFEDEFGAGARNDQARPRRVDVDLLQ